MAVAPWGSRPVFISSTFADMQAERDHLRDHVFPELEERLRERRHHLEPIDLRWGVETVTVGEQEAKELLVLKVCLNEIERSRPFLIALLGDRYGWVPPAERMQAAADDAGYQTDVQGKSVTALEIEFGVLDSPEQRQRSHFYFRDPLPYDAMPPDVAAHYSEEHNPAPQGREAAERLRALKHRIESDSSLAGRVHHYRAEWDGENSKVTGLEAWGRQVLEDLWQDLEEATQTFVRQPAPTWQEQQRWELEQFVEERGRGFLGRKDITETLLALATLPAQEGTDWGACVTGESGAGKSALFAHLYRRLSERPDVLVLAHAAGIGARSAQVDAMLRRWTGELAAALGIEDPLSEESKAEEVEESFHELLSRASVDRRVVVLVDALNQFEPTPRAQYLTWLPKLWPPAARLIVTTIPGTPSETLQQRDGVRLVPLAPITVRETEQIALAICRRHHRTLNPDVLAALLDKQLTDGRLAAGSPLWLELAVEELNLLDADDFARAERQYQGTADQKLRQMMLDVARHELPPRIEDLYGHMLERAGQIAGRKWAITFARLIAVSRHGLRESDLRQLLPSLTGEAWDDLRFATLRRAFRSHLVQRGVHGQWDFFHAQMRETVERKWWHKDMPETELHKLVADHLQSLPDTDSLRPTELMFHQIGTGERARAARYYAGLDSAGEELAAAARCVADRILSGMVDKENAPLAGVLAWLDESELGAEERAALSNHFQFDLLDTLENEAPLTLRLSITQRSKDALRQLCTADPGNAGWQRDLSVSHNKIGDVLSAQGDLTAALAAYRAGLDIAERLASADPGNAGWQRDLSVSHNKIGDVLSAQGDLTAALAAYRASLEIRERLASADPGNAGWQRDLSVSQEKIGDVLSAQGDLTAALAAYRASLEIRERLASADPGNAGWQRDLSVSHNKIGDVLSAQGDLTAALAAYRASLEIRERLASADPGNAGWQRDLSVSHNKIGDVLSAQGDLTAALAAYRAGLDIAERLASADPGNAGWQRDLSVSHNKIGDVLSAQGDLTAALAAYRDCHAVLSRMRDRAMFLDAAASKLLQRLDRQFGDSAGGKGAIVESAGRRFGQTTDEKESSTRKHRTKPFWKRWFGRSHD